MQVILSSCQLLKRPAKTYCEGVLERVLGTWRLAQQTVFVDFLELIEYPETISI